MKEATSTRQVGSDYSKCHPLACICVCPCTDQRTNSKINIKQNKSSVDLTLGNAEDMDLIAGKLPESSCPLEDSQGTGPPERALDQI